MASLQTTTKATTGKKSQVSVKNTYSGEGTQKVGLRRILMNIVDQHQVIIWTVRLYCKV